MSDIVEAKDVRDLHRRAALAGAARALDLLRRVPDLLKQRGYEQPDADLVFVLCAAIACKKLGAGKQMFRRPANAGSDWPTDSPQRTATQIIIDYDLFDLLEPA